MKKLNKIISEMDVLNPRHNLKILFQHIFELNSQQENSLECFLNILESKVYYFQNIEFIKTDSSTFLFETLNQNLISKKQEVEKISSFIKEDMKNNFEDWEMADLELSSKSIQEINKELYNYSNSDLEVLNLFKLNNLKLKIKNIEIENYLFGNKFEKTLNTVMKMYFYFFKKQELKKLFEKDLFEKKPGDFNDFLREWLNEVYAEYNTVYIRDKSQERIDVESLQLLGEMYLFKESQFYINRIYNEINDLIPDIYKEIIEKKSMGESKVKIIQIVQRNKKSYEESRKLKIAKTVE